MTQSLDTTLLDTEPLEILRAKAAQGQAPAMTALAKRLLVGRDAPFTPDEAVALLATSTALGDADAPLLEATLAAAVAWRSQSWDAALDLLVLAAERGSPSARGQLDLLCGGATPGQAWGEVRAGIDPSPWLAAPARQPICEAPRIRIADGFVGPQVCDWLIASARGKLQRAKMVEGFGGAPTYTAGRTNSDFIMDIVQADVVLSLLRARISAFVGLPTVCFEPPQILHYAVGQELKPHFDFLQRTTPAATAYQGDRAATFLLYLNDGYEGGETDFPRASVRHKGAKGDAIIFANVDPAGKPDPLTLHAGLAPRRGEKWLFSQWIHDRPFTYAAPPSPATP